MASSSSTVNINPLAGLTVAEKLTKTNFASWKAQVKSAVCGAMLEDYLTGAGKLLIQRSPSREPTARKRRS
jgi:hypothetical protein